MSKARVDRRPASYCKFMVYVRKGRYGSKSKHLFSLSPHYPSLILFGIFYGIHAYPCQHTANLSLQSMAFIHGVFWHGAPIPQRQTLLHLSRDFHTGILISWRAGFGASPSQAAQQKRLKLRQLHFHGTIALWSYVEMLPQIYWNECRKHNQTISNPFPNVQI